MPSALFPRTRTSWSFSALSSEGETEADRDPENRPSDGESISPTRPSERSTSASPLSPVSPALSRRSMPLTSTPASADAPAPTATSDLSRASTQARTSGRKRRRLAASPGGLHWDATGAVLRERSEVRSSCVQRPAASTDPSSPPSLDASARHNLSVRKTVSVDDRLLHTPPAEQQRILSRIDKGKKKLRNIHSLGSTGRYEPRKKSDSKIQRLAQRLHRQSDAALIRDFRPFLFLPGTPGTSQSLDRSFSASMTQQMQNLQLTQSGRRGAGPASPNAAKRLYRNLSEKLKGSHSSFEDVYFFGRSRKASTLQSTEAMFDAVEQQDLDTVQILLYQYTADELELNTPNGEGLTPLDVALMTNNTPIARLLLRAGAKESPHFISLESREAHLTALVDEAQRQAGELANQVMRESLTLDTPDSAKDKQLKAWEWRCKLYQRMKTGFEHSRTPEAPSSVRLSVTSNTSLTVTFQEPTSINSAVVTKYRVEWSCLKDFSLLAGEMVLENLQSLKCTINALTTGRQYYVQVSAYNMKGWGPPQLSVPPSAAPSNWKDVDGREPRRRGHIEAMERLLQQVRATHQHYSCPDPSKLLNPSRKQSVSRSLKHLFASSSKFVKTLKRGIYVAAVFYHKDSVLVTSEDQIPIVEVDDSYSSTFMQDFLWFTKLSCMWDDVRWLRQSMAVSSSSSSTLQARQKLLAAVGQLQNLLGTHNLGRVHYEPIKDRHGNVLLVTVRETESHFSFFNGKWLQVSKLQSQRKSLSTPEEPYALDILLITLQDILSYQKRSLHRLSPGLYLGYLKLSSSVDQIKVLVPQRTPNMLCHTRIRDNGNVSREEWEWLQSLSGAEVSERSDVGGDAAQPPLLHHELQAAIKSLLRQINLPVPQAQHFRVYSQEVLELGHGVCFLLLLPSSEAVCSAPGQTNPYTPLAGFLNLPLQMFELVHFCSYKEKFISLYCRLSSVLDLDALITQQALREAITDTEVATAKQRHQHITDFIQHMDEIWRDVRWLTDALQYARYKQPVGGVSISCLLDMSEEAAAHKSDSTSSNTDYVPTPSPSPKPRRRKPTTDSQPGSDEEGCSDVFLPTDSDYDSSDALSPRELDLVYSSAQDLSHQAVQALSGSAPDVLQVHERKYSVCPSPGLGLPGLGPDRDAFSRDMEDLSLSGYPGRPTLDSKPPPSPLPVSVSSQRRGVFLSDPPTKRKLLSKSHPQRSYFPSPQRWLRVQSDGQAAACLSEGVYTHQSELVAVPTLALELPLTPPTPTTPTPHATTGSAPCRSPMRDPKPSVRRIFVEPCEPAAPAAVTRCTAGSAPGGRPDGGRQEALQEVDSDDQTNEQVSEILSSTL
ncbi:ankyrin repeat and fibronectin type-III domain-containing protein 1 [Sardina pilchardus]|uniref:ankyrin repeat and fibronectin type-III domain-containing protein 1 n=1 Tax=Sardina pilchardus TaxID=27697 RepID=UPI002E115E58